MKEYIGVYFIPGLDYYTLKKMQIQALLYIISKKNIIYQKCEWRGFENRKTSYLQNHRKWLQVKRVLRSNCIYCQVIQFHLDGIKEGFL